jgi:RNA polymerase primary sigma factor
MAKSWTRKWTPGHGHSDGDSETGRLLREYTDLLERNGIRPVRLGREQIFSLGRAAKAGDKIAREELIKSCMHLVVWRVKSHWGRNKDDLIQWGNLGLVLAADRYDPDKYGALFSTYAMWWIDQSIARFCDDRLIHIPVHQRPWVHRFRVFAERYWAENGRLPEPREYIKHFKITKGRAARAHAAVAVAKVQSMFAMEKGDVRYFNGGPATPRNELDLLIQRGENIGKIRGALERLGKLSPRDSYVLLQRASGFTLDQIGKELGITRERVRQLGERALRRLANLFGRASPRMSLAQALLDSNTEDAQQPNAAEIRKASKQYGLPTKDIIDLLGIKPKAIGRRKTRSGDPGPAAPTHEEMQPDPQQPPWAHTKAAAKAAAPLPVEKPVVVPPMIEGPELVAAPEPGEDDLECVPVKPLLIEALTGNPDGLTVEELVNITNLSKGRVRAGLWNHRNKTFKRHDGEGISDSRWTLLPPKKSTRKRRRREVLDESLMIEDYLKVLEWM